MQIMTEMMLFAIAIQMDEMESNNFIHSRYQKNSIGNSPNCGNVDVTAGFPDVPYLHQNKVHGDKFMNPLVIRH